MVMDTEAVLLDHPAAQSDMRCEHLCIMLNQSEKYVRYVDFLPATGGQTIPQPKESVIILYVIPYT